MGFTEEWRVLTDLVLNGTVSSVSRLRTDDKISSFTLGMHRYKRDGIERFAVTIKVVDGGLDISVEEVT